MMKQPDLLREQYQYCVIQVILITPILHYRRSTNLYVSDANGTVQMTRTKDITHDNDITDKKYVDSAIQVAIQDTWEASY